MRKFKATISGPSLLMHNGRLANPRDPYTKALKEATNEAKRAKKSDESLVKVAEAEFQGGLYHDDKIGPYLPGEAIEAMLVQAARTAKQGKGFVFVEVEEEMVKLEYDGPRGRKGLWADDRFVHTKGARVGMSKVPRTRPIFRDWRASFHIILEEGASVGAGDVERALEVAGRQVGIGDWRPGSPKGGKFGRFTVDSFEEVKDDLEAAAE